MNGEPSLFSYALVLLSAAEISVEKDMKVSIDISKSWTVAVRAFVEDIE